MQPASQVDILIWRSVLRSSMNREYIKPIKPWRHTIPYKMSSNYMLYSSLSLIFTSHSVKMYYTCTRQLFTQPQHLMQLLQRFCKHLALVARLFGGGWDNQVSVITLLMQEGLNPAVSCALQHKEEPTSRAGFPACDWSHWFQWHQTCWLLFWTQRCSLVLNGQRFRQGSVSLGALLLVQSASSAQGLCLIGF